MEKYDYLEEIRDDEIDFVEITKILVKRKFLIIGIAAIVSLASIIAGGVAYTKGKNVQAIIGYNYEGISKGLNPDESQFSVTDLKNNIITRRTYEKYPILKEKGISLTDFIFAIKIKGLIPDRVSSLAETSLKRGETFIYNPVDYKISLKLTGNTSLDREILRDLMTEYIAYFNYKYKSSETVSTININNFVGYDYMDMVKVIALDIELAKDLAGRLSKKSFISKTTGLTYGDINKVLTNMEEIDINNIESTIEVSNITNNLVERKLLLNNKVRNLKLEKDKTQSKAEVLKGMLRDYKPSTRKMILPTIGETGVKISTEEEYYTALLKDYEIAATKVKNLEIEIEEEIRKVNELSDNIVVKNQLDKQIEIATKKYNKIIAKMNLMNQEYYNKYFADSVRVIVEPSITSNSKAGIITLAGIILGIMLGLGSAFLAEFIDHYHKNKHKVK
ncbi:hypothetical protein [Fusobacterium sp. MFO224]|uniref:hypothetical protein n=1 Tax=Fusobacterium sp. MFO224 TaxID=3378070 RepID=UPI0038550A35